MGLSRRELDALHQRIRGTSVLSLEEHLPNERGYEIPLHGHDQGRRRRRSASVEQREIVPALTLARSKSCRRKSGRSSSSTTSKAKRSRRSRATLGVSESRVSQIHAQAVIHLRGKLREMRGDLGFRENDPTIKQKYVRKPAAPEVEAAG